MAKRILSSKAPVFRLVITRIRKRTWPQAFLAERKSLPGRKTCCQHIKQGTIGNFRPALRLRRREPPPALPPSTAICPLAKPCICRAQKTRSILRRYHSDERAKIKCPSTHATYQPK